jgi:4-carboxymuconolactone decarboxylase
MTTEGSSNDHKYARALDTAEQLLGFRLETFLEAANGEPANAADFKRIATVHAFGDSWPRTDLLDTRSRALVQWRRLPRSGSTNRYVDSYGSL